jgi:serine/threonine protein kinase
MTKDLAAGMDHLAAHGIIHRDLAARNLLLEIKRSDVYRVKVCDFGLSKLSTDELNPQQMKSIPVRWTGTLAPLVLLSVVVSKRMKANRELSLSLFSPSFLPPAIEVFTGKPYTDKADVWSFGVTVWEVRAIVL